VARIYRETDNKILLHLRNGESVVDASRNFSRRERDHARALAEEVGARVLVVYVDAPEALVRQRWSANRETPARRDVSNRGFEEIIAAMDPPRRTRRRWFSITMIVSPTGWLSMQRSWET